MGVRHVVRQLSPLYITDGTSVDQYCSYCAITLCDCRGRRSIVLTLSLSTYTYARPMYSVRVIPLPRILTDR